MSARNRRSSSLAETASVAGLEGTCLVDSLCPCVLHAAGFVSLAGTVAGAGSKDCCKPGPAEVGSVEVDFLASGELVAPAGAFACVSGAGLEEAPLAALAASSCRGRSGLYCFNVAMGRRRRRRL